MGFGITPGMKPNTSSRENFAGCLLDFGFTLELFDVVVDTVNVVEVKLVEDCDVEDIVVVESEVLEDVV